MKRSRIRTIDGFEYFSENNFGFWTWYFKPIHRPIFIQGDGPKVKFLTFLRNPVKAIEFYRRRLAHVVDVEAAQAELDRAKSFDEQVTAPDWDPGGSTNNPRKVARAIREAAGSQSRIKSAEQALDQALIWRERFKFAPFDFDAWHKTSLIGDGLS